MGDITITDDGAGSISSFVKVYNLKRFLPSWKLLLSTWSPLLETFFPYKCLKLL